jgi:hypothetical protein
MNDGGAAMAFSSSPNPGVVGEDAMQAIEHDPRHADDGLSQEQAEVAAENLVEDEQAAGDAPARPRSWLDRLLGRG